MVVTATPPPLEERPLAERILEVRAALARLQAKIRDQCPGEHRYVARSGGLPCCPECGFADVGLHRSEVGLGHSSGRSTYDDDLDELVDEDDVDDATTGAEAQ